MQTRFGIVMAFLAALAAGSPTRAAAQSKPPDLGSATLADLMRLPITTATRTESSVEKAPAHVKVITARQIQTRGYRSLADLLKDLPEFKVDIGGDQDFPTELTVQGTRGTSRIVLLLDGVRIGSPTGEPLPILANYPVHNARQVEILYGPASALYGADAFSAVINIISQDTSEAPGLSAQSSVGQYGLFNQTLTFGAHLGTHANLMTAAQFFYDRQPDLSRFYPKDFQGLSAQRSGVFNTIFGPMTPNRPVSPAYDVPLWAHSFQTTLRAGGLRLTLFENRSHVSTTPAYTPDNGVYNADAFNQNSLWVAAASYERHAGRLTSTSSFAASRQELSPQSGYWNVYSNLQKSFKYAYGSSLRLEQQLTWVPIPKVALTTGATIERFFSIPQGADLNTPITSREKPGTILDTNIVDEFFDVREVNSGGYAQLEYTVMPRLTVTGGWRGDHNTRFGAAFNPRFGIVARPAAHTSLKLMYGTAFLAPTPYQEYSHYGSFYSTDGGETYASSYWHLPNPDLKPQHKKTFELNAIREFGTDLSVSATFFRSVMTNLIQESDADQAYAGFYKGWPVEYIDFAVNEGKETVYGVSIGLDYLKALRGGRRIAARAGFSFADGHVFNDESPDGTLALGAMSPAQLRLGADLDWGRWAVAPRLSVVSLQRLIATTTDASGALVRRTLPGYATVDLNLRYRHVLPGLDAFVLVENALDARYRTINGRAYLNPEELIGAPQNPRRLTIGFDLRIR